MNATRRSFLGGLAVASALSTAAAATVSVSAPENAELLALLAAFNSAHRGFLSAQERLPSLQAAYRSIAPSGEGVLFDEDSRGPWFHFLDFFNDPACPRFSNMTNADGRRIMKVCTFTIDRQMKSGNLLPDACKIIYRKAAQFDRDVEAAMEVSGLAKGLDDYWAAETALRRVVQQVVAHKANTLDGIALKVRATAAYAILGSEERLSAGIWLSEAIWNDLGEDA